MNVLPLRILMTEGRFIVHPLTPDSPVKLPPLFAGDVVPVRLMGYERSNLDGSKLLAVNMIDLNTLLSLGDPGRKPDVGFWNLTFDGVTSSAIQAGWGAGDVQTALNVSTGIGAIVTGTPCDFILTRTGLGMKTAPVVAYFGEINATVNVAVINEGDAETPAQWRVTILADSVAFTSNWSAGSTTASSTVDTLGSGVFQVNLDANAETGYFVLVVNGISTDPISIFASVAEVQNAIAATGSLAIRAVVTPAQQNGFIVALPASPTPTLTINSSLMQIPPSLIGSLDLTGAGVTEILDGVAFETVDMTVQTNGMWTSASAPVIVKTPNTFAGGVPSTPAFGTAATVVHYLSAITGLVGGGPTNLDGVHTTQLLRGTMVTLVLPIDPATEQDWQFIADPDPGVTVSDPDNGIVVPLDYNISTNPNIWIQRR